MGEETVSAERSAFLRSLALTDREFLLAVRRAAHRGYGRLLIILEHEWYRDAIEGGHPTSGILVVDREFGMMSPEDQADFVAEYNADPLFRERP